MKYISTKDAADKWGVSVRTVQTLLAQQRIPDAKRYGNYWMIPSDAQKPTDPRKSISDLRFYTMEYKCPQLVFTTLYRFPGEADDVAKSLSYDPIVQALFSAQIAYFRGEIDTARAIAVSIEGGSADRPDVHLGCLFVLSLCAMYCGDTAGWLYARSQMESVPCRTYEEIAQRDFQIGAIDSGLYDINAFPEWFRMGEFDPLPADSYPLARMLFLKWMLMSKGNPSISEVCGPIISQSRMEGALLSEIYCLILTAIGYHDRGNITTASKLLDKAIEKALPDRIFSPFAEYRSEFGVLMDDRLEIADKDAYLAVRQLNKQLMSGWTVLCQQVRKVKFTADLSQREKHAAKLAAKGLTNAQIAERMAVSVNTVKRYISVILSKTGAKSRKQIVEYIGLEGETLP